MRLIACGGTFDKRYDPLSGQLDFEETQLPAMIRRARVTLPVSIETPMLLDSLDMNDEDRGAILKSCQVAHESAIVIVHGTDTMAETARVIGPQFGVDLGPKYPHASGKTVVMTGAMIPYAVSDSDALFNLGFAFACAQVLDHGVWIAMNGRVFPWQSVRKNKDEGRFETGR